MRLPDVNVLIYAHREDAERHREYRNWLATQLTGESNFGFSEMILAAVVRIVTNKQIYAHPSSLQHAMRFVNLIRESPHSVRVGAGERHWSIFSQLCSTLKATGNLVTDCYHAALAIEHGCEWVTTDRHFARFPGLRWRHPLD